MRVCDYIAKFLADKGIKDVFMVSGGGLMFLTDGLAVNKDINVVCCHHEQAVAMAACAYGKYKGMGCGFVTTGCGGTNAITGLLNAWQDNTPCIFISGQCRRKETLRNVGVNTRQIGVQEADIVTIVSSITKYAVMVNDEKTIKYHLEKAFYLAKSGRPGPVWIDVPMDIQSAEVDENSLVGFSEKELYKEKTCATEREINDIAEDLKKAERPVIIAGQGVRLSGAIELFDRLVHKHNIPFVTSRMGTDVLPTEDDLYIGRIGNKGTRAGNFAVQNADYVLSLGSRLSVSSTGQQYEFFAREAKVTVVDIDKYEHTKNTVHIEQVIIADVKDVLEKLQLPDGLNFSEWAAKCKHWKDKWPVCLPEYYKEEGGINMYVFVEELSKVFKEDSVLIGDAGSAVYVPPQAIKTTTKKQRYVTSGAQAEMGFSLPAAVGVCVARKGEEVLAITGDGSLQMNIQELQTLKGYNLPVKLFVWNNDGYLSIRATQRKFFNGRFIGTDKTSGVSFPELEKIAYAYDLKYVRISNVSELPEKLKEVMSYKGPVVCEVMTIRDQVVAPSISSKKLEDGRLVSMPPEDMFPFLDREEFYEEMVAKPVESK
ncbi:MAG: thiamine pyrophosphate-binding protein [Lachnospiraceae bacterium]|nr:thiamine pyrophosphate-binding protein [Lachnospiraceae bacterium]